MPKAKRNPNRILSVTVKRVIDTDRDTSWLGEYSNTRESDYSIDRKHSLDCPINTGKTPAIAPHTLYECGICDSLHPWEFDGDCRDDSNRYAAPDDYAERNKISEYDITVLSADDRAEADAGAYLPCDCDEVGDMERNQYRYFNPSFNYVGKDGKPTDNLTPEEVRKYTLQDYKRMESLNRGDWCFIGIRAEASIAIPTNPTYSIVQRITSGGLWGTESDSERSYFEEVAKDELADLKDQLTALGFSKRAISVAFKSVKHEEK